MRKYCAKIHTDNVCDNEWTLEDSNLEMLRFRTEKFMNSLLDAKAIHRECVFYDIYGIFGDDEFRKMIDSGVYC